jgi:general nucleoside transport system permease protein
MAVPTVQRRSDAPAARLLVFLQKLRASFLRPIIAVVVALIIVGIMVMFSTGGSLSTRFNATLTVYQYLYLGSFGNLQNISYTLVLATSLIFTGLSVAIAYRAGLFNIGAAGQLTVGAMVAGLIAFREPNWPGWLLVPLMLIVSALAGAVWGAIVGLLKAWRGAHEVVTTIMLNWIAFSVAASLVDGPLQAPNLAQQTRPLPPQAQLPSVALFYNGTLGKFLPPIANPTMYTVDVSIIFAIIVLIIYWFITARTSFGYELRVIGQNVKAARYAGISVGRNMVIAMALAGAFAGLAGSCRLMGQAPYQLISTAFSQDSTGFNAIGVALLGRTTATGVLLSSLLFGGLQQASGELQILARIPGDVVTIIQALVLFSIAIEFLPSLQRIMPSWLMRSGRPELVPDLAGIQPAEPVLAGEGSSSNGAGRLEREGGTVDRADTASSSTGQEE